MTQVHQVVKSGSTLRGGGPSWTCARGWARGGASESAPPFFPELQSHRRRLAASAARRTADRSTGCIVRRSFFFFFSHPFPQLDRSDSSGSGFGTCTCTCGMYCPSIVDIYNILRGRNPCVPILTGTDNFASSRSWEHGSVV